MNLIARHIGQSSCRPTLGIDDIAWHPAGAGSQGHALGSEVLPIRFRRGALFIGGEIIRIHPRAKHGRLDQGEQGDNFIRRVGVHAHKLNAVFRRRMVADWGQNNRAENRLLACSVEGNGVIFLRANAQEWIKNIAGEIIMEHVGLAVLEIDGAGFAEQNSELDKTRRCAIRIPRTFRAKGVIGELNLVLPIGGRGNNSTCGNCHRQQNHRNDPLGPNTHGISFHLP